MTDREDLAQAKQIRASRRSKKSGNKDDVKSPDKGKSETGPMGQQKDRDVRWYLADTADIHDCVMSRVARLRNRQRARREMYRYYLQLYGVNEFTGLGLTNYEAASIGFVAPSLPYNVVRRGVNT